VSATDAQNDPITFSLDESPDGMTINSSTGLLQWTPGDETPDPISVIVRVSDPGGLYSTQSYSITVTNVNDPPEIISIPNEAAQEGSLYDYQVEIADPDLVFGDTLLFSLDEAPEDMTIDPVSGLIEWTPPNDASLEVDIVVRVEDDAGAFDTQAYTIEIEWLNDSPQITSWLITEVSHGAAFVYQVEASDPDTHDLIMYSVTATVVGVFIDPVTGRLEWDTLMAPPGFYLIEILAEDLAGGFDVQAFTLTVNPVNWPPLIVSTPPTEAIVGEALSYRIEAVDGNTDDSLRYSVVAGPAGLNLDAAGGLLTWIPSAAQLGPQPVTLRVTDRAGLTDEQSFTVEVFSPAGSAPVASFHASYGRNVTRWEDGAQVLFASSSSANAIDAIGETGGTTSGWTPSGAFPHVLRVGFVGNRLEVVDRARIQGESSINTKAIKDYEIRVATSTAANALFTTVLTGTLPHDDDIFELTFPPVLARQVELRILSNYGSSITDVPAFEVLNRPKQGGIVSLTEGGAQLISASSGTSSADDAFDFEASTVWAASTGYPQFVKMALSPSEAFEIDQIFMGHTNSTARIKGFRIRTAETSSDDSAFSTLLEGEIVPVRGSSFAFNGHWFQVPSTRARYIELIALSGYGTAVRAATVWGFSSELGGPLVSFDNFSGNGAGPALSYLWDFGDSSISNEVHPTHYYAAPGKYTITLTVTDAVGRIATATRSYTVLAPPSPDVSWTARPVFEGATTTFQLSATAPGGLMKYRWQRGDLGLLDDDFWSDPVVGWNTKTAIYDDNKETWVELVVLDAQLLQGRIRRDLSVLNRAPTADPGAAQNLYWGERWRITSSNDDVSLDEPEMICTFDFGDGSPDESVDPCTGDGAFFTLPKSIVHSYDSAGNYTATLIVSDGLSETRTFLPVTVHRRPTSLVITETTTVATAGQLAVKATLIDLFDGRGRRSNLTMEFESGGTTVTATTDANGTASAELPYLANQPLLVEARFFGNADYTASFAEQRFDAYDGNGTPRLRDTDQWSGNEGSDFEIGFPHFSTFDTIEDGGLAHAAPALVASARGREGRGSRLRDRAGRDHPGSGFEAEPPQRARASAGRRRISPRRRAPRELFSADLGHAAFG
jgi:PKD repeat protein